MKRREFITLLGATAVAWPFAGRAQGVSVTDGSDSAYADATNTGVPAGKELTTYSGNLSSSANEQIIELLHITGNVTITHKNVTMRYCKVVSGGYTTMTVGTTSGANPSGFRMHDCEVDGQKSSVAIEVRADGATFLRLNAHNAENIFDIAASHVTIQDSYIWGMAGSKGAHFDSIQMDGAYTRGTSNNSTNGTRLLHNTVINTQDNTSCLMLDNYWGGHTDFLADSNRIIGGGDFCIYCTQNNPYPMINILFTNNRMDKMGAYDYFNITGSVKPVIMGNIDDLTGLPIPQNNASKREVKRPQILPFLRPSTSSRVGIPRAPPVR